MFSGSGVSKSKTLWLRRKCAKPTRVYFNPNYSVGGVRFACASAVFPATRSRVIRKDCNSYASGFARPPPNPSRRGISEKGRKSRETLCCFQSFPVPGCRKVNSLTTTEVRKANARLFHPNYSVGGVRFACASAVFPATRSRVIRKDCNSYASGFARPPTQSIQERHKWKRSKKSRNTVLFPMFSGSGVSIK